MKNVHKTKTNPYAPVLEINQENALWIAHCINKKSKPKKDMHLAIEISQGNIHVNLYKINPDSGMKLILSGSSKHNINDAIRELIDKYALRNIYEFVFK